MSPALPDWDPPHLPPSLAAGQGPERGGWKGLFLTGCSWVFLRGHDPAPHSAPSEQPLGP